MTGNTEKRVLSAILDNFVLSAEQEKRAKEILASALKGNAPEVDSTEMIIKKFVDSQEFFSINPDGRVERNVLVNEFQKFCYLNKISCTLKRDEIIEMVKDEYYIRSESKLSRKEFFDSLRPQSFKYRW